MIRQKLVRTLTANSGGGEEYSAAVAVLDAALRIAITLGETSAFLSGSGRTFGS